MLSRRQCRAVRLTSGLFFIRPPNEGVLFELHHGSLDVLTARTFEGTEIETRLLRLNARQIHLRRAFWARRPYINWRIFKRVFRKGHLRLLLLEVGALPNFHSLTPDYVAVGVPQCDSASWSCAKQLTTRNVDNLVEKFQTEALPVRKAPHWWTHDSSGAHTGAICLERQITNIRDRD